MADPPRVPIIFVLGGPGSGKITHCDRLVQERPGTVHINMTDLIQQHIVGNGMNENDNGELCIFWKAFVLDKICWRKQDHASIE